MVIIGRNTKILLSIWAMSALSVDGKTEGRGNGVSKLILVYCYSDSYLIYFDCYQILIFKYQGLRRDHRAKQTFDASFLYAGFCTKLCDKICLSLGTESCTGICNHQCNSEVSGSINANLAEPKLINQSHSRTLMTTASSATCSPSNVRSIRIESTTGEPIQMFELQAYTTSGREVATGKVATQSLTFKDDNVKFGASNSVDGNNSTFSHTNDASSIWEVDLAGDFDISYTSIQNRWCGDTSDNSNCLCRLTNAKLSLLDVQGEVMSSVNVRNTCGTVTVKNDFEYASRPAVSARICMYLLSSSLRIEPNRSMCSFFTSQRKVKLQSTTGEFIQLFELEVYSNGANVAVSGFATQSSTFNSNTKFAASKAIDGDNATFSHTAAADTDAFLEVNLNGVYDVDSVLMRNRWCQATSDPIGCLCRLSSATLTLLDENYSVIATRVIGNTCNQLVVEEVFTSCPKPTYAPTTSADPSSTPSLAPTNSLSPSSSPSKLLFCSHCCLLCIDSYSLYKCFFFIKRHLWNSRELP
jgi:hypothetical protein